MHKLIFFDGSSGVGKSTLCELTKDYLVNKGFKAQKIKYPTSYLREMIRDERYSEDRDPFLESYLFAADFRHLFFREVLPVKGDTLFLLDRSYVTSCADSDYGWNNVRMILDINRHNPRPDLLLILYCSPETAMERIKRRVLETGIPISKKETLDYIAKSMRRYVLLAESFNNTMLVNTEEPIDAVLSQVTTKIEELCKL